MAQMREIGKILRAEQHLIAEDIAWLVVIGQAILRAFVRPEASFCVARGQGVRHRGRVLIY